MGSEKEKTPPLQIRLVGDCAVRLWGLSSVERLQRQLRQAGVAVSPADSADGAVLLLRTDYVYDQRIIHNLIAAPNTLLRAREGEPSVTVAAHVDGEHAAAAERLLSVDDGAADALPLRCVTSESLVDAYIAELLKAEAPLLLPIQAERRAEIERRLFDGSYKGITDVVTKYVWPIPARWITHLCVATGIRPNHVTLLSILLVLGATAAFAYGWFGTGLVLAWLMTFFDTVDGKLARVTVDATDLGHFMDKILDIVHPPFWYIAWGIGLTSTDVPLAPADLRYLVIAILGGYIVGRLAETIFKRLISGFSLFSWRPFDSGFRLVLARRNPCLLLLTASLLLGRPDLGVIAVAAWTVACGAVLVGRVLQATYERSTGRLLHPWLRTGVAPAAPWAPERRPSRVRS